MTTYLSVFKRIRKYEYDSVFQIFLMTKYAQAYLTILVYAKVGVFRHIWVFLRVENNINMLLCNNMQT